MRFDMLVKLVSWYLKGREGGNLQVKERKLAGLATKLIHEP
jgi:hypothetical protein